MSDEKSPLGSNWNEGMQDDAVPAGKVTRDEVKGARRRAHEDDEIMAQEADTILQDKGIDPIG